MRFSLAVLASLSIFSLSSFDPVSCADYKKSCAWCTMKGYKWRSSDATCDPFYGADIEKPIDCIR